MTNTLVAEKALEQIHEIPLAEITISHDNVRHSDPTKNLDELAASIKKHGLLQPVVLKGEFGQSPYQLISGQRRFLAHQILHTPTIRAVFAGNLSKTAAVIRSLVENLQRLDLRYEDTAKAVTYLYEKFGKDDRAVQRETGLSLRKVRDFILIEARATPRIKKLLTQREVSPADVKRAIRAAQDNMKKAEDLIDLIIKNKPTAHQKRRLVLVGESRKGASAESIFNEAQKPQIEQTMVVSLPEDLVKALTKATKSLALGPEELAVKVLGEWLRAQGFAG
jgi:ParB family transcriptional regulator, chromosome partitioning protein